MRLDEMKASLLSAKIISNVNRSLLKKLRIPVTMGSIGIFTTDCDDVSYVALDEATKKAAVRVVYAKSMYAGSSNASTQLAGEFIGILAGENPEDVRCGLDAAIDFINNGDCFKSANYDNSIVYFNCCIARTGTYLSKMAKIPEGSPIAYLIAPPLESVIALDYALKAADVDLTVFYGPPTQTNFGGGILTGEQAACRAACDAFEAAILKIAENPCSY